MKIISLVPSITETLLSCKVDLVGRSRFCIHPQPQIENIPKIGGTKDIDWSKSKSLKPDLVILDKEENTKQMADTCPFNYFALHITNISDVAPELFRLAKHIQNSKLMQIAKRWEVITHSPSTKISLNNIPGIIDWWKKPKEQVNFEYIIWKEPWMAIGNNTFIQSMLDYCGLANNRKQHDDKYPVIKLEQLSRQDTLLLFSSEPFPFQRYKKEMIDLGFACALIDGEKFSWYGLRSLEFLENMDNK
ncbi:helical backbone metal receptor [Aliikangiella sp. IMCC44359]|uniref:helical backbone metal receptor n=1 Tax=Aliikangiella sp. IMCC44359 TaxID=3459125 RepID=UPI00403B0042